MGLVDAVVNQLEEQFTREKEIKRASHDHNLAMQRSEGIYNIYNQELPIAPQNALEEINLQRAGYIRGAQDPNAHSHSPTAYTSPETHTMNINRKIINAKADQALQDYKDRVSNPLFNVGDTVLDVLNNTVGLPLKALGGQLFADPSELAKKKYKQDLLETSKLQAGLQEHYRTQKDNRNKAFQLSMGENRIGAITPSHYTTESIAKFQKSGNFNDLEFRKPPTYRGVDGNIYTPTEEGMVPLISMETQMQNQADFIRNKKFAEAQAKFNANKEKLKDSLKGARQKHNALKINISDAIKLVKTARAAGWNGLFKNLPATAAKDLDAKLKTIKANVAFAALQEMRNNSPTGGALGNVSDQEIQLLYNSLMPLEQLGTDEMLIQSLEFIQQTNTETLRNMNNKFYHDEGRYAPDQSYIKFLSKEQQDEQAGQNKVPQQTPNMDEITKNDPKVQAAIDLINQLKANQED